MPKLQQQFDSRLAALAAFQAGFRTSARGNLTCEYEDLRLTVYKFRGGYGWSIYNELMCDLSYSREQYETQADALSALARELDVGR